MAFAVPKSLKPIVDFTVQIVFGAIGFLVVFGVAVAISVVVKACDGIIPAWTLSMVVIAEKALFIVDLFCFSLFVLSEVLKLIRGLWNERSS